MKLNYPEVELMVQIFEKLELKGKESRHRSRFITSLLERAQQLQDEHRDLLHEYAIVGESDQLVTDEEGRAQFDNVEKIQEFQRQYNILISEYVPINIDEYTVETVTKIILDGDFIISTQHESKTYDELCTRLESEQEAREE